MIEHVKDFRRIKRCSGFPVHISPQWYYLIEVKEGDDIGVFVFHPFEDGLSVHVDLGEKCRGKVATDAVRRAFEWIFANTDVNVIHAIVPNDRKDVCNMVYITGFRLDHCDSDGNKHYRLERFVVNEQKMAG